MTTRRVKLTVEFDVDDELLTDFGSENDWEASLERVRGELELDVRSDWPGGGHKVTLEYDRDPEPVPNDTPGHLITPVVVYPRAVDPYYEEYQAWCACGWKATADGGTGGFTRSLAERLGQSHIFHVKQEKELNGR